MAIASIDLNFDGAESTFDLLFRLHDLAVDIQDSHPAIAYEIRNALDAWFETCQQTDAEIQTLLNRIRELS